MFLKKKKTLALRSRGFYRNFIVQFFFSFTLLLIILLLKVIRQGSVSLKFSFLILAT